MLYYTGAAKYNAVQKDSSKSLGGYKSISIINNNELHNVFSQITKQDIINGNSFSVRLIVFENPTTQNIQNIKIYTNKSSIGKYELAVVTPSITKCDEFYFEKVDNENSLPYQGIFEQHLQTNPLIIDELQPQQLLGIWIKRVVEKDKFSPFETNTNMCCNCSDEFIEWLSQQQSNNQQSVQDLVLHIKWD